MALADEQSLLHASLLRNRSIGHHGDRGEENEQVFIGLLRKYLPNRYTVDKGHVLDHEGNVSDSIDVVVYDRQYTPPLLDGDDFRYILAESVYAVFDCKPSITKCDIEYTGRKAASVRRMKRTLGEVHHLGGTDKGRPHSEIIGGILAIDIGWEGGLSEHCRNAVTSLSADQCLHLGYAASGHFFNHYTDCDGQSDVHFTQGDRAFAAFIFGLLARLSKVGTSGPVDWHKYAQHFSMEEKHYV